MKTSRARPDLRKRGNKLAVTGPWSVQKYRSGLFGCRHVTEGVLPTFHYHKTEGAAARHCERLNRTEGTAK